MSLDTLLDEAREQQRGEWSPGLLDFILMAYRYTHLFRRELERFSRQKLRPETLGDLLQLSFAALLTRDKIPPSALVSETVEVAKKRFGPYTASFTNAFLRQTLRQKDALLGEIDARPEILLGEALQKRWSTLGAGLRPLAKSLAARPEKGIWSFDEAGDFRKRASEDFLESRAPLQAMDPGSWALVGWIRDRIEERLLAGPGTQKLLDACAAPGGKCIALRRLFGTDRLRFYATEAKYPRLERLRENLARWQYAGDIATSLRAWGDAAGGSDELFGDGSQKFSIVLADLPCSGSGTLATRPDLLVEDIQSRVADLKGLQSAILNDLKTRLEPHGCLVVSLCSIDPEEVGHISQLLGRAPDFHSRAAADDPAGESLTAWLCPSPV